MVKNAQGIATSAAAVLAVAPPEVAWAWARTPELFLCGVSGSVAGDDAGNVFMAGHFFEAVRFGTNHLASAGSSDANAFLAKYDSSGSVVWARQVGGTGYDWERHLATDAAGNVFMAGKFSGSAWFGNLRVEALRGAASYVVKFDGAGQAQWVRQWTADTTLGSPAPDSAGNVYVAGVASNPIEEL